MIFVTRRLSSHYIQSFESLLAIFAVHASDNTAELRLIMDFSSIEIGEELFQEKPKAFLDKHNGKSAKPVKFEWDRENIFSAVEKNVLQGHTLMITWKWDAGIWTRVLWVPKIKTGKAITKLS